jgi:hypothetical protein
MTERSRRSPWLRRLGIGAALLGAAFAGGAFLLSRADGPLFVFAGGPLRSGEEVAFDSVDWEALDDRYALEMEIVAAGSSRTLWFSVHDGVPYVACDLDCVGGVLTRWPQQIEQDDRVVVRIDGRRVPARLTHVPHGTAEYAEARAERLRKYSPEQGGRAAAESTAHDAVVGVGEVLTGRSQRDEPGDRMYRVDPRG